MAMGAEKTEPNPAPQNARSPQDQRLEQAIANLLRIGVLAAAALVFVGGILALRHTAAPAPNYTVFHPPGGPQSPALASISAIIHELGHGASGGIMGVGLLVLIATPVARVLFAMLGFAWERDWLYTGISLVVFAILIFSLLHGR